MSSVPLQDVSQLHWTSSPRRAGRARRRPILRTSVPWLLALAALLSLTNCMNIAQSGKTESFSFCHSKAVFPNKDGTSRGSQLRHQMGSGDLSTPAMLLSIGRQLTTPLVASAVVLLLASVPAKSGLEHPCPRIQQWGCA